MSSQKVSEYKKGDLIFREGAVDPVLYDMAYGTVGIIKDYGLSSEVKIGEISEGFFGENGLLENEARNATAVALEDTGVIKLDADAVKDYFVENPVKLDVLLQGVSTHIREADKKYIRACELIDKYYAAENKGEQADPAVIDSMRKLINTK